MILAGWAGQISLGQFALVGAGAVTAGKLAADHNVDFFLALFLQADVPSATRERLTQYLADARRRQSAAYELPDVAAAHPVRAVCHLILTLPEFQLT